MTIYILTLTFAPMLRFYKHIMILLGLFAAGFSVAGQTAQALKPLFQVDTAIKFTRIDPLQNLYVITELNTVIKYDSLGHAISSQDLKNYGEIDGLDVTNPLQPVFFYSKSNTYVFTDNNLYAISSKSIDHSIIGQFAIAAVSSNGDGIWFFDATDATIKELNPSQQIIATSQDFSKFGISDLTPTYMIEKLPWLYVSVPDAGLLVFDSYAAYSKTLFLTGIGNFQIFKNNIVYYAKGKLNYYDLKTKELKTVTLPFDTEGVTDVKVSPGRIWVQTKNGIKVYNY